MESTLLRLLFKELLPTPLDGSDGRLTQLLIPRDVRVRL